MVFLQRQPLIDRLARSSLILTAVNMKQRRVVPVILLLVLYTAFVVLEETDAQTTISSSQENNEEVEQPVEGEEPDETEAEAEEEEEQQTKPELVTLSVGALLTDSTVKQSKESIGTTTEESVITQYRVNDSNGNVCILLRVDCSITFTYKTKSGSDRDSSEYVPEDAKVTGNCKEEDNAVMTLSWETFTLTWNFAKTPGGERWYVDKAELQFTASDTDKMFQNINKPGYKHLKTQENMLFPTPVGKSYSCPSETTVELRNGDISAKVFLRGFKLQPFIFKREFGPEYICSPGGARAYRDETAPIAVGSTLAIVVLLTVTGYGVYRYFKIKKVQYDTME